VVVGEGIGMTVEGLLIEQLGFEQVAHLRGAGTIVVAVQAQVLLSLFDAVLSNVEELSGLNNTIPGVLHTDLQEMSLVELLVDSFLRERMRIWTEAFYVEKKHIVTIDEEDASLLSSFYDTLYLFLYSKKERSVKGEVLQSLLRGAFLCLSEQLVNMRASDDSQEKRRPANILFQQFLDLLGSTPVKHRPVDWYASELCVTAKHLSAVCKSSSGKTANEWIREHVLEDIRYCLKQTDLSMKQISDRLGFPNPSFFGKYVKEHFGMTPIQFKQKA